MGLGNDFLGLTPKVEATKEKIDKSDYIKMLKLFRHYQSEKAIHRMGEHICKSYYLIKVNAQNLQVTPVKLSSNIKTTWLKNEQRT